MAQAFLTSGTVPARQGNAHLQIVPYQLFPTADGWLVLAVGNDQQWQQFCQAVHRPELGVDPRFATNSRRVENRGEIVPVVETILRGRTTKAWENLLGEAGIPHASVWDYDQLFASPQVQERGLRVTVRGPDGRPIDLLGTPFHIAGSYLPAASAPPVLGQDTDDVLGRLLGLGPERIAELRQERII
jgi:crotonobetainyl-CoA:carnitine CoA-transferase CaiB-like acyl-CoA transferase